MSGRKTDTLWTRDFTIITVGSVISMLGNTVSGFAMSLLVLDISRYGKYSGSQHLFAFGVFKIKQKVLFLDLLFLPFYVVL